MNMGKVAFILLAVTLLVSFTANLTQVHVSWLLDTKGQAIVSRWEDPSLDWADIDMIAEFATLPNADRAVVAYFCKEVSDRKKLLVGTKGTLPHNLKPGCQRLLRSGWHLDWTLADGIEFLSDKKR